MVLRRGRRREHDDVEIDLVAALYEAGNPMRDLMQDSHISYEMMCRWLDSRGVERRHRGAQDKYEVDLDRLRGMVESGMSERAMGLELGVNQGVIRRRKYDLGLLEEEKKW